MSHLSPEFSTCPESGVGMRQHGPADRRGVCPWCGWKYTAAVRPYAEAGPSDLTVAYEQFYDPDWGGLGIPELERRRRGGQGAW